MHIIGETPLGKEELFSLFESAEQLRNMYRNPLGGREYLKETLRGHTIALLFLEPSVRTYGSFYLAAQTLGADILPLRYVGDLPSTKGETITDTVRTIADMEGVSAIVMRHPQRGAAEKAARIVDKMYEQKRIERRIPIINAGDGDGWHPTQAYLDLYTLWRHGKLGRETRPCGTIFGDLYGARAIHSLLLELSPFLPRLYLISPPGNKVPYRLARLYRQNTQHGSALKRKTQFQGAMAEQSDFYYFIRLQKERLRGKSEEEIAKLEKDYIVSCKCSSRVRDLMRQDALILHPGPMGKEMSEAAKWDSRFLYDEQVANELWIRAALFKWILNPEFPLKNTVKKAPL